MTAYHALGTLGLVAAAVLVVVSGDALGLTWRGVFLCLGLISVGVTLFSLRLHDPGYGIWDTERLRAEVRGSHGRSSDVASDEAVELGFSETLRRVMVVPTNRTLIIGAAFFGFLTTPLATSLMYFLDHEWNLGVGARSSFFAFFAGCGVVALTVYGRFAEKQYREAPAKLLRVAGLIVCAAGVAIAVGGAVPGFAAVLICFGVAGAGVVVVPPVLSLTLLSIVPAPMRPHAQALLAAFTTVGALVGVLVVGGVNSQFGSTGVMIFLGAMAVVVGVLSRRAGEIVDSDFDRLIADVLEDEEIRTVRAGGGKIPMLACRGIDFSYGQLQVLFDVDFGVDEGEMVALLGVNGAGKSTLLKVISGIGLPSRGSIRFRGEDITYLDAERRVSLGITQVPGGRAVFGRMTVIENLRSFGFTLGRDRKAIDHAIDVSLEAFPRLRERRNSLAAQLSGGEQQMLGLSKALILQPRLLLIDELSLGLAPIIVGRLLDMVRQINATGTAVVLVEQSVNIALNLVHHAYFMEKGEIRFDGPAQELLARDDLLRSVFLHGASAGVGS